MASLIYSDSFKDLSLIKSLTMPISSHFDSSAFNGVTGLTSVHLTKGTGTGYDYHDYIGNIIETPWLKSKDTLTSVILDDGIESIGDYTFYECKKIASIDIPESVVSIGSNAFRECTSLLSITIPSSVTSINYNTFYNCSSLISVFLPPMLNEIFGGAFYGCSSLESITIPDSVTNIGWLAFSDCVSLSSLTMAISSYYDFTAFEDVSNLINVHLTKGTGVGYNYKNDDNSIMFTPWHYSTNVLTTVVLDDGIESIGDYTFFDCNKIESIDIPDSVTSIGNGAFSGCDSLTSLKMPISTSAILSFDYVNNLTEATFTKGTGIGYLYNSVTYQNTPWYSSCADSLSIFLDDDIEYISDYMFCDCSNISFVAIPKKVSEINSHTFSNCSSLKTIVLPESLESIGEYAFSNCTSLETIVLPESLESIGEYAFSNCSSLKISEIPHHIALIGNYAFLNCISLESLLIPESIISIGLYPFFGCNNNLILKIENAYVPNGWSEKWDYCNEITKLDVLYSYYSSDIDFWNSFNIEGDTIIIPDGVYTIPSYKFYHNSTIKHIVLPSSLKYIGDYAFTGSILESISFSDTNLERIGSYSFQNCRKLSDVSFSDNLVLIEDYSFNGCEKLQSISLPDSVISIGNYSFLNCTSLVSVILPNSLCSIGNSIFCNCSNLKYVNIPDSVLEIKKNAFKDCTSLASIIIPDSVNSIGDDAFSNCISLTSLQMPISISAYSSFDNVSNLEELWFSKGNGVGKNYYNDSYMDTPWYQSRNTLLSIHFDDGIVSIGSYSFKGCNKIKSITIPDSVTLIGEEAFYHSYSLESLTIPISLSSLPFEGTSKLKELHFTKGSGIGCDYYHDHNHTPWYQSRDTFTTVLLDEGIESIGNYTFYNCYNIKSIVLPSTVTEIGTYSLFGCSSIVSLVIPASLTTIDYAALYNCSNLSSVIVDQDNTKYDSRNNCNAIVDKETSTLILGCKNTIIDDSVISIASYAFKGSNISYIDIPYNVISIGSCAFENCIYLKDIVIPSSITIINSSTFHNCSSLLTLEIPNSITEIHNNAFSNCISLSRVNIPDSITIIDESVFMDCSSLEKINIPDSITSIKDYAFRYCSSLEEIEIPDSVTNIGKWAFKGCIALKKVKISNFLSKVDVGVFEDCTNISSLTMPIGISIDDTSFKNIGSLKTLHLVNRANYSLNNSISSFQNTPWYQSQKNFTTLILDDGITSIGAYSFYGCYNLKNIRIPDTLIDIGDYAFYGCSKISPFIFLNSVKRIGSYAFGNCLDDFEGTMYLPSSITFIGSSAFHGIANDTKVYTDYSSLPMNWSNEWNKVSSNEYLDIYYDYLFEQYNELTNSYNYSIHFDGNGEQSGSMEDMNNLNYASNYYLPRNNFAKENYYFIGWNTAPDGSGDSFDDRASIKELSIRYGKNITLYANWGKEKYTIEYILNSGNNNPYNASEYDVDSSITLFEATKDYYKFDGWFLESDYINRIYSIPSGFTGNITLYAKWIPIEYLINYNLNGGTLENRKNTYNVDTSTFSLDIPIKLGYEFLGWSGTDIDGLSKDVLINKGSHEERNYTANWQLINYIITYDLNGGLLVTANLTSYNINTDTFTLNNPTRDNCEFIGWTGTDLTTPTINVDIVRGSIGDRNYKANFKGNKYLISYVLNGGINSDDNPDCYYYAEGLDNIADAYKLNSNFDGWYSNDGTDGNWGNKIESISNDSTGDITLYAKWLFKYNTPSPTVNIQGEVEKGTLVTLDCSDSLASIYYTTDGSDPTNQSTLFENQIEIIEDKTIKAIAINENKNNSEVVTFSYTIKEGTDGDIIEEDKEQYVSEGFWTNKLEPFTFDPSIKKYVYDESTLRVYDHKTLLTLNKDYTVSYKNNTKAGNATLTITGKGNYTSILTKTFEIKKTEFTDGNIVINLNKKLFTYNGKAQKPSITSVEYKCSTDEKTYKLKNNVDYVATIPSNSIDPGDEYEVTILGKGNYQGMIKTTYKITNNTLASTFSVSGLKSSYSYTGQEIKPDEIGTFVVKSGKTVLEKGTHYTINYNATNTAVGTATMTITAIDGSGYEGTLTKTFKITGTALSSYKLLNMPSSVSYKGYDITIDNELSSVAFSKTVNGVTTTLTGKAKDQYDPISDTNVDYVISYQNNKNIGTATVIFEGVNGFTGTVKKTFKITGDALSKYNKVDLETKTYTGSEITQDDKKLYYIDKVEGRKELEKDNNYTITYQKNINAGTATVIYTGINGYSGTIKKTFKINKQPITNNMFDDLTSYSFIKGGVKPTISSSLELNKDYTVKYTNNTTVNDNTNPKKITKVTITGKGNYQGTVTKEFTIEQRNLSDNITITVPDKVYSNKANIYKSTPTLIDTDGKKLAVGTDYDKNIIYTYKYDTLVTDTSVKPNVSIVKEAGSEVSPKDIIPVNTIIEVKVTGTKNYKGELSATYRIITNDISKASVTIPAQYYTGKPISLSKSSLTVKIGKTVLSSRDFEIVSYTNNTAKGSASITIKGKGSYGGTKTIQFNIQSRTLGHTIKFNSNGGTGTMKDQVITKDTALLSNSFKYTGKVFVGWNTKADGTGYSYSNKCKYQYNPLNAGQSITLYAIWQ